MLGCYLEMLGRIRAEEMQATVKTLLATNGRELTAQERIDFHRELEQHQTAHAPRPKVPKASRKFLREAGFRMS